MMSWVYAIIWVGIAVLFGVLWSRFQNHLNTLESNLIKKEEKEEDEHLGI